MLASCAWLEWQTWASSPASSHGQGQMNSNGREVTSGTLYFFIVSQRTMPLLWALFTSPSIHICCVRLAREGSSWAFPPILHKWPQALIAHRTVQIYSSAVGIFLSSNVVVFAWMHLNRDQIVSDALDWSIKAIS